MEDGIGVSMTAIYLHIYIYTRLNKQTTNPTSLLRIRVETMELEIWKMEKMENDETLNSRSIKKFWVFGFHGIGRQKREWWGKVFWIQRFEFSFLFVFSLVQSPRVVDVFKALRKALMNCFSQM